MCEGMQTSDAIQALLAHSSLGVDAEIPSISLGSWCCPTLLSLTNHPFWLATLALVLLRYVACY